MSRDKKPFEYAQNNQLAVVKKERALRVGYETTPRLRAAVLCQVPALTLRDRFITLTQGQRIIHDDMVGAKKIKRVLAT